MDRRARRFLSLFGARPLRMKTPSLNILAISLAFPPLAYPRSIQVARLLANTDASTALFCASEPGARHDASIEPMAEDRLAACIRVPVENGSAGQFIDRITYKFARTIWNRRNLVPDRYSHWRADVIDAVSDFLDRGEFVPDAIVTFAQPFSDHLIGLELRSRLTLPWLAHFSDPWVDNPFSQFDRSTRKANLELERTVAETADILAFTSQETIDLFFEKYPPDLKQKARLLPQSYDPALFESADRPQTGNIKLRYIGNFYGRRTPSPLISALIAINKQSPAVLQDVSFELIGGGDAEEVKQLSSELPSGLILTRPSVSYRESLDLMMDADGLMVIDAPAEQSVFLPSKLIDYLGAGRPIVGITPKGTADSLIREIGGLVADPSDQEGLAATLEIFIKDLKGRRDMPKKMNGSFEKMRERYSVMRVVEDFRKLLIEITPGSPAA